MDADAGSEVETSTNEAASPEAGAVEAAVDAAVDALEEPGLEASASDGGSDAAASDGAVDAGCGAPTGGSSFCSYEVSPPAEYVIDFGVYPGTCSFAHHTHPIVMPTPAACCGDYSCACLQAQDVCDQAGAPEGALTVWEGCGVGDPTTGMLVVTCQ